MGAPIFLLNFSAKSVAGPFVATTALFKNIAPNAFGGKFPWQVRVDQLLENLDSKPRQLVEQAIGQLPSSNKLDKDKTRKLIGLFSN